MLFHFVKHRVSSCETLALGFNVSHPTDSTPGKTPYVSPCESSVESLQSSLTGFRGQGSLVSKSETVSGVVAEGSHSHQGQWISGCNFQSCHDR